MRRARGVIRCATMLLSCGFPVFAYSVLTVAAEATLSQLVKSPGVLVATDFPDLQAAVDALPLYGGVIVLPPGTYKLNRPLNLSDTYNTGEKTRWITLQGSGKLNTTITGDFPGQPLVDATCAGYLTVRDLTFSGNCKTLWLSARRQGAGGGGNMFENCMFRGDHAEVTMWLIGSECNCFVNTEIYNSTKNGVCVAFLPVKQFTARGVKYNIESPYVGPDMTGSSTTTLRFYGSFLHSFGLNSIGLFAQGSTGDISISGGYHANRGFASIYLDGSTADVSTCAFRDLRIEGETGLYCLYATGAVHNVAIDSGNWGSAGEVVRYESAKEGHGVNSGAQGWTIRNASLTIQDQSVRAPEATGAECKIPRGERAVLRLDRVDNLRVENSRFFAYQIVRVPKDAQAKIGADGKNFATVIQNEEFQADDKLEYYKPKLLVCSDWAKNCTIQAGSAGDVVLPANSQGMRIECLADDDANIRRTYLGLGGAADILNLAPIDLSSVATPHPGDLAMEKKADGTGVLSYYNGRRWIRLASEPEEAGSK